MAFIILQRITERGCQGHTSHGLPNEEFAYETMNENGFIEYVKENGYHFTSKLADWATKKMENANGNIHNWTSTEVANALASYRSKMPTYITDGDLAFSANMCYADFFPVVVKTEDDCLRYANRQATDPDGYEGMIFSRWLADVIGKNIKVNWEEVI